MKGSPIRMIAGALLFAAAPCASAPSPAKGSSALDDGGARRTPSISTGAERGSEEAEIHRELGEARIRLSRTEARLRHLDGHRAVDELTRAAIEAKTRAALEMLSTVGGITVRDAGKSTIVLISPRILFAPGAADLLPRAEGPLGSIAEALSQDEETRILIEDRSGPAPVDDVAGAGLSQKRLNAVRDFLAWHGVRRALVTVKTDERASVDDRSISADDPGKEHCIEVIVESEGER